MRRISQKHLITNNSVSVIANCFSHDLPLDFWVQEKVSFRGMIMLEPNWSWHIPGKSPSAMRLSQWTAIDTSKSTVILYAKWGGWSPWVSLSGGWWAQGGSNVTRLWVIMAETSWQQSCDKWYWLVGIWTLHFPEWFIHILKKYCKPLI